MRKITIILLAAFILCFSCAFADGNVWVEETWEQVDGEIDCDGLPLVIHAKTLKVPENLEDMIQLAKELLNGRELTEEERSIYRLQCRKPQ